MNKIWIGLLLCIAPLGASAQSDLDGYEVPDIEWVWEDGYTRADGVVVQGFYRPKEKAGFVWEEPVLGQDGGFREPGWRPQGPPRGGHVWVPGYRGDDGYWVDGAWRPVSRDGYDWVDARQSDGVWVIGHWRPKQVKAGHEWVPGHWTADGEWIDGFWREPARRGFVWVPGRFHYGHWHHGHWRPTATRRGEVWVVGHHGPNGWVDGAWRPAKKSGHYWTHGHWRGGTYVVGRWVPGARVARRFAHPGPVRVMLKTRAHSHRVFKVMTHPGKAAKHPVKTIKVLKPGKHGRGKK